MRSGLTIVVTPALASRIRKPCGLPLYLGNFPVGTASETREVAGPPRCSRRRGGAVMGEQLMLGIVEERRVAASEEEQRPIQRPSDGTGPLLQRDYVVVLEGSGCTPEAAVEKIRSNFP